MQIVPRKALAQQFRQAGLEAGSRTFSETQESHRLTVREREPKAHVSGPHRKIVYPDGRVEGPFPVADRPALSRFIPAVFAAVGAQSVLATVAEGAFWLNNKSLTAYLTKVADAQRVSAFLRRRGLTDRFQGGFRVMQAQFDTILPWLAANTYAGGGDVQFAALEPASCRLTALACHHFDIHFTTPDASLLLHIRELAEPHNLCVDTLALPELPDSAQTWLTEEFLP